MFCNQCGNKLEEGQKFCTKCGRPVEENSNAVNTPEVTKETPPSQKQGLSTTSKVVLIVSAVVAVMIVITAVVLLVLFFKKNPSRNQTGNKTEPLVRETPASVSPTEEPTDSPTTEPIEEPIEEPEEEQEEDWEDESEEEDWNEEPEKEEVEEMEETADSVDMGWVKSVSASSCLSEYNMTHSAERICDGSLSKAWVEGARGQGIGQSVTLEFEDDFKFTGMQINAGYQKSRSLYKKNSRPKKLTLTFSDGTSQTVKLKDIYGKQKIALKKPVVADEVTLTIKAVYPGNKYKDTVISEVSFY